MPGETPGQKGLFMKGDCMSIDASRSTLLDRNHEHTIMI